MKYGSVAALAALNAPALVHAASGALTVLTMNVAGLPAILQDNGVPGDKTANSERIGSLFAQYGYDVINVQEDFNYHAYIYANDNHPYRTPTSGGAVFGSGLNTLSNYEFIDFRRIKWDTCSNDESDDCLTPKGFTFMRVRISEGNYIDMYNLHADAGTSDADEVARPANLAQVSDYISTWSTGNSVILFGDTNSRYTRTADNIGIFTEKNGMTDVWYTLVRKGNSAADGVCDNPSATLECEIVDKVFYRGSHLLDLQATAFDYVGEKFLQSDGNVLTDHDPVLVNLTYTQSATLQQSDLYGGPHGEYWFNDAPALAAKTNRPKASTLKFAGASRLDSVSVTLDDGTTFAYGGDGGDVSTLTLGADEYWTGAELCQGQKDSHTRNFYIKATTSKGNSVSAGSTTDDCKTFTAPAGFQIVGFAGQHGDEMDQLAFVYGLQ
ncbi:hypothetical protein TD95_003107 [Thielaviopsis punctulata]|uniref:Jacalin-type lectin domain-containing protein n=1 Tax=Thielaviopsis punctulata TaxID=72032 RepID=A0A0F4ZG05_9PEZI|nr:hypothetical protein TD95_003107 [Thielaviopsis punctulata]